MSDFDHVRAIVHEQRLEIPNVEDPGHVESISRLPSRRLGAAITDVRHRDLSTELAPHTRVNTFRTSPAFLQPNAPTPSPMNDRQTRGRTGTRMTVSL